MAATLCLVLYGSSVFLAGIKSQLEQTAADAQGTRLLLVTVAAGSPNAAELIRASHTRVVLFDLSEAQSDASVTMRCVIPLLRDQPGLLLLGVDPNSNDLLVLSGTARQALNVDDLVHVIRTASRRAETNIQNSSGGNHEKHVQTIET